MPATLPSTILLVDDEPIIHRTLGDYLGHLGFGVESAYEGDAGLSQAQTGGHRLVLLDLGLPKLDGMSVLRRLRADLPDLPVVIMTGDSDMQKVIRAMRLGATDFISKPIRLPELDRILERCMNGHEPRRDTLPPPGDWPNEASPLRCGKALIGDSKHMARLRRQLGEIVQGGFDSVLITGETGTGKEIVARACHEDDPYRKGDFVAVSCPALPEHLVESELFGHVRGAFTGALEDRKGCFELADGGTLFLDEIGDLSAAAQAKLLRVLETRSIRPVGSESERPVDVRVVAASNAPLFELVEDGSFRRDLFYRLNLYHLHIPPLRERRTDILPLARHFLNGFLERRPGLRIELGESALRVLQRYNFPGNVRELRNLIERAAIVCERGTILAGDLGLAPNSDARFDTVSPLSHNTELPAEHAPPAESHRLRQALKATRWNRREAASRLGIPYSTFRYRLKKHRLG